MERRSADTNAGLARPLAPVSEAAHAGVVLCQERINIIKMAPASPEGSADANSEDNGHQQCKAGKLC